MTKPSNPFGLSASILAMASLALLTASEADAQRRGGGGGRASASMSRPSMSGGSSRQVRSSASSSLNYGGNKANRGGGQMANASTRPSTGAINSGNRNNVNTGNINSGNRTNINTGNINTGDVNINVDGGHGCCYGDWDYHPVAAGVAVGTAVAVTRAWRVGAYYSTLPTNCVVVVRVTVTYYQCGTYWYQPTYSGMTVQYVAVATPK